MGIQKGVLEKTWSWEGNVDPGLQGIRTESWKDGGEISLVGLDTVALEAM